MAPFDLLLAVALKGALVLALAGLAAALLRRAPASARHVVWAAAFAALLLLPVLEMAGPRWAVSILPPAAPPVPAAAPPAPPVPPTPPVPPAPPAPPVVVHGDAVAQRAAVAAAEAQRAALWAERAAADAQARADHAVVVRRHVETVRSVASPLAASPVWSLPGGLGWLALVWALGALAVAVGWLSALASARRLVREARPVDDDEWSVLADRARRLSGLPAHVRLLRSDRLDVPVAWGWGPPAVVLPASADTWTDDRREAVLLHEMAHLRRRDAWTQLLAQAAVALHWANPLAWLGYRRFLEAREEACDDAVLQGGARPSAYAEHLVGVARGLRRDPHALAAMAPMARRAPLESRIRSVLDASRPHRRLGRGTLVGTVLLAAALVLPLAAFHPTAREALAAPLAAGSTPADTLDEWDVIRDAAREARAVAPDAPTAPSAPDAPEQPVPVWSPTGAAPPAAPSPPEHAPAPHASDEWGRAFVEAELARSGLRLEDLPDVAAEALAAIDLDVRAEVERALADVRLASPTFEVRAAKDAAERARRQARAYAPPPTPPAPPAPPIPPGAQAPPAPSADVDWDAIDRARRDAISHARRCSSSTC